MTSVEFLWIYTGVRAECALWPNIVGAHAFCNYLTSVQKRIDLYVGEGLCKQTDSSKEIAIPCWCETESSSDTFSIRLDENYFFNFSLYCWNKDFQEFVKHTLYLLRLKFSKSPMGFGHWIPSENKRNYSSKYLSYTSLPKTDKFWLPSVL